MVTRATNRSSLSQTGALPATAYELSASKMFSPDDTIVAIATPPGRGGIGVVRISGPRAIDLARAITTRQTPLEPRRATFTRVRSGGDTRSPVGVDTVVVTSFPAPHSYTGQDVVEISAHGSPVVLRAIVRAAIDAGARLAQPGEFTLRAFLSGKLDLVQAEAVAYLIAAATPLQARVAFDQLEGTITSRIAAVDAELFDLIAKLEASLDFPDEGYHFIEPSEIAERIGRVVEQLDCLLADASRGRMIREGATVVIAGRPNVGKSSLFNALAGADRAIVTEIPGTTRDLVTEPLEIEGVAVTLVDTAGLREALDVIELEGVARGARARDVADLVIVVIDGSEPLTRDDEALLQQTIDRARVIVANKADRPSAIDMADALRVSARRGDGLAELRTAIGRALMGGEPLRDTSIISNMRHVALLDEARGDLVRAREAAASAAAPEEFLLSDLQAARARFDEIVGTRTSEDVLQHIFERFCIGK
jgi:tRNA modification GTPase